MEELHGTMKVPIPRIQMKSSNIGITIARSIHIALKHDDKIVVLPVIRGKKFNLSQWFNRHR